MFGLVEESQWDFDLNCPSNRNLEDRPARSLDIILGPLISPGSVVVPRQPVDIGLPRVRICGQGPPTKRAYSNNGL